MAKKKAPAKKQDENAPDKGKYPHGEKEQPIGNWWNPDPSYKECPIGQSQPNA